MERTLPELSAKEAQRQERAEDIAYTINHAVSCGMTDTLIAPTISALFGIQVGCADPTHDHSAGHAHTTHDHTHHDHSHCTHDHGPAHEPHQDHSGHSHNLMSKWPIPLPEKPPVANHWPVRVLPPHTHEPAKPKLTWKLYRAEAWHYFRSEMFGDFVAVPLTIMVQRFFPQVMDSVRQLVEPLAAPFFRAGARKAAEKWGNAHGLSDDSAEVVDRAQQMYRSEMKHLPQAVVWNVFAFPIGAVAQKMGGHSTSLPRILRNKTVGALISNGILLGGRALAPDVAERVDTFNSRHIVVPTTKIVGKLFGVNDADVDRMAKKHEQPTQLLGRVAVMPEPQPDQSPLTR